MAAHHSLVVTQLYAHATDEARRTAADRLIVKAALYSKPPMLPKRVLIGTRAGTRQDLNDSKPAELMVPRGGIEPPTRGFSVPCSTD